ncbi:MAG: flagellar motor stator protein MotA [Ignavibacteria bacterium]|nr:flagellar motor stator protein MotA [Ignavibacteria bacterium]
MLVIVGLIIVIISIIGGLVVAGGNPLALIVPAEYIIIGGSALGSLLIANPLPTLKRIISGAIGTIKGPKVNKTAYIELLQLLYELFQFAKREGLIAIESHIENPDQSSIFSKYPTFLANQHAKEFLTDTLKVVLSGGVPAHDLEELMDIDIENTMEEELVPAHSLQTLAEAFPGLGIVAAVMGIIVTMASVNEGAEAVGHHVAAALVGTFLGVLMCYGIIGPTASLMNKIVQKEIKYLQTIKAALLAFAKGAPASVAIEYGRRSIDPENRPTFQETEQAIKQAR